MNTHISIQKRLRRHDRDVTLLERLFSDWARGREQRNAVAHQQLDAIEAQLARLERSVRMTESSVGSAFGVRPRRIGTRTAMPLAVQQS